MQIKTLRFGHVAGDFALAVLQELYFFDFFSSTLQTHFEVITFN